MRQDHNSQIKDFLDYYFYLSIPPQYAVLLKGKWGSGKTWFIENLIERLKEKNGKALYVSLYGIGTTKDIEDELFRQLHPVLGSKKMALVAKVAKGLLKGTIKVDLDGDGRDDGAMNVGVPDINLPEYLRNAEGFVLIFDDVERCSIPISDLLGYINFYVEHGGYKVVLVANEEEILNRELANEVATAAYSRIKEKLIGKSFEIEPDFEAAMQAFMAEIDPSAAEILKANASLISSLYSASEYKNLRHLRQTLLEYARLIGKLNSEVRGKAALLSDLLETFLIYSFEVRSGAIQPQDIRELSSYIRETEKDGKESVLLRLRRKYSFFLPIGSLLPIEVWADFFEVGLIDHEMINSILLNSKYFASAKQPDWVNLWHGDNLSDDAFAKILVEVSSKFESKQYTEIPVLRHVVGMLLQYSSDGVFAWPREKILAVAKSCVDELKAKKLLVTKDKISEWQSSLGWMGLAFMSAETDELREFNAYVLSKTAEADEERRPAEAEELLSLMTGDIGKFSRSLLLTNHEDNRFYKTPILSFIDPSSFVQTLVGLSGDDVRTVAATLNERYKFGQFKADLAREQAWLQKVADLLNDERVRRPGKISGVTLGIAADAATNSARQFDEMR